VILSWKNVKTLYAEKYISKEAGLLDLICIFVMSVVETLVFI